MPTNTKKPKYRYIADMLRSRMQSGELKPGDRLPSFVQMHRNHGATETTMRRVYELLEKDNLIERRSGSGIYVLDGKSTFNGKRGVMGRTGVIGVNLVTFAQRRRYPYYGHLLEGIHQAAQDAQREILLLNDSSSIKWEKVDGVLLHPPYGTSPEVALEGLPPGMPCVSLLAPIDGVVSVLADEAAGVRAAIHHLLELGHRRIAFLTSPLLTHRLTAYQDALGAAGISPSPQWVRHARRREKELSYHDLAQGIMGQWLREDWKELGCTAILAQNDDAALGVIEALRAAKIKVPQDVSVVGFDGTEVGERSNPSLTSIAMPLQEIGATSVELLLQQMRDEPVKLAAMVLPAPLQTRQSTAKARTG